MAGKRILEVHQVENGPANGERQYGSDARNELSRDRGVGT